MKKQIYQKFHQPKHYDFNSMILSGKQPTIQSAHISQQQYSSKVKQIKALKRFQQLFRKQLRRSDHSIQQANNKNIEGLVRKQSPHQLCNRLKGMFFLRRKAELQNKYRQQSSQDEDDKDQENIYNTIKGKTVSPSKQRKSKFQDFNSKPFNFVDSSPPSVNKFGYSRMIAKRPRTQLESSFNTQKIFNNQTLYTAVLAANKVKIMGARPAMFTYFSVYVQEGNNSELIKSAVRKRSGWKVVQMPAVANMIWSQFYKKSLDIKMRSKKQTQKSQQMSLQSKFQTLASLNVTLGQVPKSKYKKMQKQIQNNPNLLPFQEFNRQMAKLCPKQEHKHRKSIIQMVNTSNLCFYNHIPNNHLISDKKNLLRSMKRLYQKNGKNVFQVMPFSLDIDQPEELNKILLKLPSGTNSSEYWIVKPGQNSNRGRGIIVCKGLQQALQQVNSRFSKNNAQNQQNQAISFKQNIEEIKQRKQRKSVILQKYIQPLLYFKRKFDIRMYLLVTNVNKKIRGYVYEQGYVRTSSQNFTMQNFNKFVHLTNDAIQTKSPDYGKFQEGNKVSWKKFQKWMEQKGHQNFWPEFVQFYKRICKNILQSVRLPFTKKHSKHFSQHLLYDQKRQSLVQQQKTSSLEQLGKIYYEIFGLDFLIQQNLHPWLIQVNTNPAITTECSRVVNSIVPKMIDNAFAIAVQPFLKQLAYKQLDTVKFENGFQVIYDDQW